MQQIHHTHLKKAQKAGIQMEPEHDMIKAFWPARNLSIFGPDAKIALMQMLAAQRIIEKYEGDGHEIKIEHDPAKPLNVRVMLDGNWLDGANPPALWASLELTEETARPEREMTVEDAKSYQRTEAIFAEDPPPTKAGVPTNGRKAHQKGFTIMDCPFEDDDDGPGTQARWKWEEEWEASAEEASTAEASKTEDEEGDDKPHSVVKTKYRAIYAERGHPTHCGDEMANKLNGICIVAHKTDMGLFDAILKANGVDMSKYNRISNGWQGRYRMTGRNILARVVYAAKGELKMPETINGGESVRLSAEWLAEQRFK